MVRMPKDLLRRDVTERRVEVEKELPKLTQRDLGRQRMQRGIQSRANRDRD
jgi:hypothetical protein